ncbi:hypothetical protein DACRYDRAFT_23164 [Dacryopinax primogenitus]|uniref:Cyclin N-terminal domain-containing protein n=1 Tax=Dacryopinax primogenitus (strain DJM 731) TaxID=1858805 RepID=M5FWU8_DACPD|nr:uncharacterized protein DACRYDRAFT_23164 [Dacryopinax primogenitus]EJU00160.1 hypothetical protein DACRYDRAFT_23164 [Dacryopinax primogenitus]
MTRSTPYHASLVDRSEHSPELLKLLYHTEVSRQMIVWLAEKTKALIPCSNEASLLPTPPHTPPKTTAPVFTRQLPSLERFIRSLVERSRVHTATLLSTCIYLDRIAARIPKGGEGLPDTCHRIFLATLITASKALNDSSPKNSHWVEYARFFTAADVIMMEKQLLALLDYNLLFTEAELMEQLKPFLPSSAHPTPVKPVTPARAVSSRDLYLDATPPALERSGSDSSLSSVGTPSSTGPRTPLDGYTPSSCISSPSSNRMLTKEKLSRFYLSPSPVKSEARRQPSILRAPPAALRKLSSVTNLAYSPYPKPYETSSKCSPRSRSVLSASSVPTLVRAETFLDRLICKRTKKQRTSDSLLMDVEHDDVFMPNSAVVVL